MKSVLKALLVLAMSLAGAAQAYAQRYDVTAKLTDEASGDPVMFATVSLTVDGAKEPSAYVLSGDDGAVKFEKIKAGAYTLKAELLGFKPFIKKFSFKESINLGTLKMTPDTEQLDAAKVSAVGNPIIIKKDTVEYNASSFKTTDNDMLEDLLKKLPGIEVGSDGSITSNGKTINKITIDGKTFFLDDPSLASKNLPAKMIEKVKVVDKKSDQAMFTGIDDGEQETVIDLSVRKGMMNGMFGNVMAGGGHDWQNSLSEGEGRYQAAGFLGNFKEDSQLSLIVNANNTNNRGFNDLAGSMMGGMRGGGGGMGMGRGGWGGSNGITTSYMAGVNGAWDLLDDAMQLGGNYMFSGTEKSVLEKSNKTTYLDGGDRLVYNMTGDDYYGDDPGYGHSFTNTYGHRVGVRLEHKFSEKTSILFEPRLNFGSGNYSEYSRFETSRENADGSSWKTNDGLENTFGLNSNWSTSGFLLFRQRLGKAGRTISVMSRYSFSGNGLDGYNQSLTNNFNSDGSSAGQAKVNQLIDRESDSQSLSTRLVYTEPIAEKLFREDDHLYLEGFYSYSWSNSVSIKNTYDMDDVVLAIPTSSWKEGLSGAYNDTYSNEIRNGNVSQETGVNFQYQTGKMRLQIGGAFLPTTTHNVTNSATSQVDTTFTVYNWSPQGMFSYEFNDNTDMFMFYRGRSSQPSTNQLMPVPDNSDPLNVSFGNPYLKPYFSHSLRGHVGYTNKKTFFSVRGNFDGGMVQSPITNAIWYGTNGAAYSMPLNGPNSYSAGVNFFVNAPFGQSGFSISNMARANYNRSASYIGKSFNTDAYYDATTAVFDYAKFNADYGTRSALLTAFTENVTQSISLVERFTVKYTNDKMELSASARTRMNKSTYTVSDGMLTWANQVRGEAHYEFFKGFTAVTRMNYNWYRGYTTPQESEYVWDAELSKTVLKGLGTVTLKAYDLLNQSKNLSITDNANYHQEMYNNTLGRYIMLSFTMRFGTFGGGRMGGGPGGAGFRGPMGPPPGR